MLVYSLCLGEESPLLHQQAVSIYRDLRGGRQRLSLCSPRDDNFWEFHLSLALQVRYSLIMGKQGKAKPCNPLTSHLLGYFLARAGSCSWVGNKAIFPLISPPSRSLPPRLVASVLICHFTSAARLPREHSYMKEEENPHGMLFSCSQTEPL